MKLKFAAVVVIRAQGVMECGEHTDNNTELACAGKVAVSADNIFLIHDNANQPSVEDASLLKNMIAHLVIHRAAAEYDPGIGHANIAPMNERELAQLFGRSDSECMDKWHSITPHLGDCPRCGMRGSADEGP